MFTPAGRQNTTDMKTIFLFINLLTAYLVSGQGTGNFQPMQECIIRNDSLVLITVDYDPASGSKTVLAENGRVSFESAYPSDSRYAHSREWYVDNTRISFRGSTYEKFELPRVMSIGDVVHVGAFDDVGIYALPANSEKPPVIYVPVRTGCEFQAYQLTTIPEPDRKPGKRR
jgi:hypothetical protein